MSEYLSTATLAAAMTQKPLEDPTVFITILRASEAEAIGSATR